MSNYPQAQLVYGVRICDPEQVYFQGFDDEVENPEDSYPEGLSWIGTVLGEEGWVENDNFFEAIPAELQKHGVWVGLEMYFGGRSDTDYTSTFLGAMEAQTGGNSYGVSVAHFDLNALNTVNAQLRIEMALRKLRVQMKLGYEPSWHLIASY